MRSPLPFLLLALAAAAPSQAAQVRIDFDFSGSQITVLGGVLSIPPDGSLVSATGSLFAEADGTGGLVQPGPAQLKNLTVDAAVSGHAVGSFFDITGSLVASQQGAANGLLTAGLANAVLTGSLVLGLDVFLACTPATACAGIGTFPVSLMGPQTLFSLGSLPIGNVNSLGNATIAAQLNITFSGLSAVIDLVGTEIARTVVPEPGSGALLAGGLAAAGAVARLRRGRRRSG